LPTGYTRVETPFGVLTNIPVVWLALAAPLAWRGRFETPASILRWFVTAAALLFGTCALTVVLFNGAVFRYEADFLPALVLLAVMGILGMERALAATPESGLTDRPVWRRAARCGWGLLLGFSVVFNLLVSVEHYAEAYNELGIALMQSGKTEDAIGQYKQALQINPESVEAHVNLGSALLQMGKVQDAVGEYKQALRINPSYAEAHNNLGAILQRVGKLPEAIQHYERALRSKPEYVDAHFNMGLALEKMGRVPEAIEHYEQALKLRPDFTPASNALARLRAGQ
jgi:tetratricopeptide (TPR) repeat protein